MYQYRNQLKGNNVGFARIETRDTQCKITVNIRVPNMKEQDIKSYIYCWYNKEMHGVFLGNVHINNGVGELVVKTDVDNIMNSKYRFTDMSGILLYVSEAQYLGTEWDGKSAICNGLFIDQKKPDNFTELIQEEEDEPSLVAASSVDSSEDISLEENQADEISTKQIRDYKEDNGSGMDALIEDEMAKEVLESNTMTATMMKPAMEEEVVQEEVKEPLEQVESQQTETEPELETEPETEINIQEQQVSQEKENEPELSGTFPLSQEKIEHLDQQAQELFGTMLFNSLFPNQKEEKKPVEEKVEESITSSPEENIEAKGMPKVNPKTAIECFTAFRSCESEIEYEEIQDEIKTMHAQIAHLERLSEEWRIKRARIEEEHAAREESEREQQKIEQELRASYHIDGIEGELGVAQLGGNVIDRIFSKYPKIQPFREGEVEACIRIEPQDLGIFPMENWILANNSFLLHGYYSYRHLIFAMEEDRGRKKFVLGVPGVNHSRERFMANMFGFNEFKNLAQQEEEDGDFGYWCQEIHMHV